MKLFFDVMVYVENSKESARGEVQNDLCCNELELAHQDEVMFSSILIQMITYKNINMCIYIG